MLHFRPSPDAIAALRIAIGAHNPKIRIRGNPINHSIDNHKHRKAADCYLRKQLHVAHAKQNHDVLYYVEGKGHVEAGHDDGEQEDGAHLGVDALSDVL